MKIHICPKCGSTNLKSAYLASPTELSRPSAGLFRKLKHQIAAVFLGWQPKNPSVYICKDCDYQKLLEF